MPSFNVAVVAPDLGSALSFNQVLNKNKINTKIFFAKISPRVEGNYLTSHVKRVVKDLHDVFEKLSQENGIDKITIACNTLSLSTFINPVLKKHPEMESKLFLSFSSIKKAGLHREDAVILGTKPLVLAVSASNSRGDKIAKTLTDWNGGMEADLDLVQEIIWRVKAIQHSDISTCLINYEEISSLEVLKQKLNYLTKRLKDLGIKKTILACTELPFAFELMEKSCLECFEVIDPAELIAKEILNHDRK